MKRILYVCAWFPPMTLGMAVQNYYLVKHLREAGINLEVIYTRWKGETEHATYPPYIEVVDRPSLINPIKLAQFVLHLTRHIDKRTIVSANIKPEIFLLAIWKIAKGFPLTIRIGGHIFYELRLIYSQAIQERQSLMSRLKHYLSCKINIAAYKFILVICNIIFVDGYDIKRSLMAEGISGDKIVVIYNGVDLNKFSERNINDIALHPTDKTVIMFFGRLSPENGPMEFLKILSDFSETYDNFLGVLLSVGPLRREMEEYVKRAGLNEKVSFLGFIPDCELPSYLAAADIMVIPLQKIGGISQVVTEAMAMGKPMITTNVGDVAKVIEHGVTGFIYENDDLEGISDMLKRLHTDKGLRDRIGGNASRFIRENYGWDKIIKEYIREYDKL
jgi:glycosyltransferase involved in cell wall biosynthesis